MGRHRQKHSAEAGGVLSVIYDPEAGLSVRSSDWGIIKGDKPITIDQIKKAARYWLPLHAVGRNLIQSHAGTAGRRSWWPMAWCA